MALGDVYRLQDYQIFQGQECVNLWDYKQVAVYTPVGMNEADDVLTAWNAQILGLVVALQSDQVTHTVMTCGAFGSYTDFSSLVTGAAGLVAGDALPSVNAWGFKMVRTDRSTRHGSKRIPGISEAWQANGVKSSAANTAIAAAETGFPAVLTVGGIGVFIPVITRLDPVSHLPTNTNQIATCLYRGLTTQKSRQPGHGT